MKVLKKGIMPDGTDIQIEDWSEDYSFHSYGDTLAAYPVSKATLEYNYPVAGKTFRADFQLISNDGAERAFDSLVNGSMELSDLKSRMRDPKYADCI